MQEKSILKIGRRYMKILILKTLKEEIEVYKHKAVSLELKRKTTFL